MVQFVLTIVGNSVGVPLELLVIGAMLHGGFRRFPLVFAYVIAEFLTTCVETPLALESYYTRDRHVTKLYVLWYWGDEIALQVLVFGAVLSLIWLATSDARSRRVLRMALIAGVILFAGISFVAHISEHKGEVGEWMTPWARDLNFGAAILDMFLWAMLITRGRKELLMLSGGLGIMFTGEAIGESIRTFSSAASPALSLVGSILILVTNLAFLYVWWQTFRAPRAVVVVAAKFQ